MPDPVLSAEQWQALKLASIRGVSDADLSASFGVSEVCIRVKRTRDKEWKSIVKRSPGRPVAKPVTLVSSEVGRLAETAVSYSLERIASENPVMLARHSFEKIRQAIENDIIAAPQNWKELATATNIMRQATGQDKPQAQVAISLWGNGPVGAGCAARDVTPVETQQA